MGTGVQRRTRAKKGPPESLSSGPKSYILKPQFVDLFEFFCFFFRVLYSIVMINEYQYKYEYIHIYIIFVI